jgi:hypothetical protein
MHIHILGICGTFMGGVAALAAAAGHRVSGCDANVYPPMSTQLKALGIDIHEGFDAGQLDEPPDCVVVGNVMTRGTPVVEAMLDRDIPYQSGPEWLGHHVLRGRHVFAVAGTHGKTTTSSMLAWILQDAGLEPGFLIGGIPANFDVSARFGKDRFFVVEADEYDTAFFDKRAKFVHYRPNTLVLNNLEYDHADIYRDLDAIIWKFHQLLRTVPGSGRILVNRADENLDRLLSMGCWTDVEHRLEHSLAAAHSGQPVVDDRNPLHRTAASPVPMSSAMRHACSTRVAASSHEWALARSALPAAGPPDERSPESPDTSSRSASTQASASSGSTRAIAPNRSAAPANGATTAGVPHATASSGGLPNPSASEGKQNAEAAVYSPCSSRSLTCPIRTIPADGACDLPPCTRGRGTPVTTSGGGVSPRARHLGHRSGRSRASTFPPRRPAGDLLTY